MQVTTRRREPRRGVYAVVVILFIGAVLVACGPRRPHSDYLSAARGNGTQAGAAASEPGTGADGSLSGTGADANGAGDQGAGGAAGGPGGGGAGTGRAANGATGGGRAGASGGGASDVGVTADSILVGNITSVGGALGPNVFSPSYFGASAYFRELNAKGGINGRQIKFVTCDDKEDPNVNLSCAQSLVQSQKVFAMVANDSRVGNGSANYINSTGAPSVGDFCIGNWCAKYPHIWGIPTSFRYPRDGKSVGVNGKEYAQDGPFKWLKDNVGVTKAAVFFYNIAISRQAGLLWADSLRRQGVDVVYYGGGSDQGENPAAPTFDADVVQMRSKGVDIVVNAIDMNGFQKLCQSMDRYSFTVKANVGNPQAYGQIIGSFSSPCRNSVFAFDNNTNYADPSNPEVARMQAAMKKYYPDVQLHQWALTGWASAAMFAEAVAAQGPNVTRAGVERWLAGLRDYTGGGLEAPHDFQWPYDYSKPSPNCFSIAQWQDSAKMMVTRAPISTCLTMPWVAYTPSNDGS